MPNRKLSVTKLEKFPKHVEDLLGKRLRRSREKLEPGSRRRVRHLPLQRYEVETDNFRCTVTKDGRRFHLWWNGSRWRVS